MREVRARMRNGVFVVALGASAAVALAGACTDDVDAAPSADAGDDGADAADRAQCPREPPPNGSDCTLPEGTTCGFGQCTPIVQCTRGVWRWGTEFSAKPPCPELPPDDQSPCPRCWPRAISCTYGSRDCSLPDASDTTSIATCVGAGVWSLDVRPCRDGGGPDVQRDGEAGDD
ncbi:MAG: hypothetical protein JST00_33540 [Deltaproteobacteria bacterium]|nr:hypothetical protein [Deltaproteobacteria bacterium]